MQLAVTHPPTPESARLASYSAVSTSLALHSDRRLGELVDAAVPLGSGIGGRSALLEVDGKPVFVKRVPLTDIERVPEHARSTANLYGIPAFCHYGVGGGPGFGAWRELAVHTMTTNWVLAGHYQGFPMMYHWRVLPDTFAFPEELADVESVVAYWRGSPAVRRRVEDLQQSSGSLALFLEYIPQTLDEWLTERIQAGEGSADRACYLVERELEAGTSFMNARGLLHFDAHFQNILVDGRRLYFTDYGLAVSSRFDLSPSETSFFEQHRTYDRCYTRSWLVNRLITKLYGYERKEREALIRSCAAGEDPPDGPQGARAILSLHAPLAAVMTDFYVKVQDENRQTPYPSEALRRALREDRARHG
ncbi:serine/threonine-protein kinase [Streptomyces heilongjiangensis]|uniref:Serine/threonine-protein kinase n=1 Tax=Streptomyces heilongjiangensis TaxID=945052 RepID=A0ABW1BI58_9ACTN|nr:serine/threonine-protein kinase [Streptomyces heilongjiangensis]MDC2951379.1 serine/threonine-protein kinase [Streptomyces heilongjiangensis]